VEVRTVSEAQDHVGHPLEIGLTHVGEERERADAAGKPFGYRQPPLRRMRAA
jgi:hypothetical protein